MNYLSPHFSLGELTITEHRTIDNRPTQEIEGRLAVLALEFLEPLRDKFGPLRVTSGYRCRDLNLAIGGAIDSAHMYGCAADLQSMEGHTPTEMVQWVMLVSDLPFDQVIDEGNSVASWLHIGMLRPGHEPGPRRQALRYCNGVYTPLPLEG